MIGTTLVIFAAFGVAGCVVLAIIGPILLPLVFHVPAHLLAPFRIATVLFAIQVAADLITEGAEACVEGLQRVDRSRAIDAYRRTVVAIGTAAIALATGSLVWVAAVSALASVTAVLGALIVTRRDAGGRIASFDFFEATALMRYGRTIAVLRPLGVVQRTMDRVIVGIIVGPAAVALVEVATQVLNGADAILSATSYAVIPGASWLRARADRPQLAELLYRGTKYSVLSTWLVCAAGAALARPFVHVWVGSRYDHAPTLIAIALAGEAIAAPSQVGSSLLLGTGRARNLLVAAGAAVFVNLVASVALVEVIGTTGTFIGTLIGNIVLIPVILHSVFDEVHGSTLTFARRVLIPCAGPAVGLLGVAYATAHLRVNQSTQLVLGSVATLAAALIAVIAVPATRRETAEMAAVLRRRL